MAQTSPLYDLYGHLGTIRDLGSWVPGITHYMTQTRKLNEPVSDTESAAN